MSDLSSKPSDPKPAGTVRNIYGRRPGRGWRPYLIVGKVLCVACFFGGLMAVWVGVLLAPEPADVAGWQQHLAVMRRLYVSLILPGLLGALVFGTLLFSTIWQAMLRMRWFVVKMALIITGVPALHVYLRGRTLALREILARQPFDAAAASGLRDQIAAATGVAILLATALIVLGRVKPRLGQEYGRTFAKGATPRDRG